MTCPRRGSASRSWRRSPSWLRWRSIEKALKEQGQSREWLAEQLGVDRSVLWRWMMGERTPRVNFAAEIQRLTRVSVSEWSAAPKASQKTV